MVTPKRDPEPLSDEDEQLALSLGVAILAAGNPRQFNTTGDMARAYVRELRRQPLAATHLPAELRQLPARVHPVDLAIDMLTPLEPATVKHRDDPDDMRRCVSCRFVVWPRGGHQQDCPVAAYLALLAPVPRGDSDTDL